MTGEAGGPAAARPSTTPSPYPPEPEAEGLTLRDYLAVMWRRKWIILLVVVVATASAYYFSSRQTTLYQASADLIYEKQLDVANPLTGQTYTDPNERNLELRSVGSVIVSPDMLERAGEELAAAGVNGARYELSAEPVTDTSAGAAATTSNVVRISATGPDPRAAAAVANAYSVAFVAYREERVQEQIKRAMKVIKRKLSTYDDAAKETTDYLVLQQRLQDLQILKATATGNFRVLVPATAPKDPVEPKPLRSAILGLGVGLFAGIGLAFLLEQFDTRVRRPEDVAAILRVPVLGRVPRISRKLLGEDALVTRRHPDGHIAETFRMVRTNLEFMAVDEEVRSLVLTSSLKGEGKSVTVANLAIAMAMAGKKVVVVDADLRRPRQHKLFELDNEVGVSTVATGATALLSALQPVHVSPQGDTVDEQMDWEAWAGAADSRARLYVLPSGPIPPNPGEIVGSQRFQDIVASLNEVADVVLVDSPAMLAVGDTSALAASVDGFVFLVDMEAAKKPQLFSAADQLSRLPTRLLGVVVRMHGTQGGRYYYSPSYYYHYSYTEDGQRTKLRRRKTGRRDSDRVTAPPEAAKAAPEAAESPPEAVAAAPEAAPPPADDPARRAFDGLATVMSEPDESDTGEMPAVGERPAGDGED